MLHAPTRRTALRFGAAPSAALASPAIALDAAARFLHEKSAA